MAKFKFVRPYMYIDKNPVIDKARTMLRDVGLMSKKGLAIAARISTLSPNTLDGWFDGDVRDPRHSSIARLAESVGYEMSLSKVRTVDIDTALVNAKEWAAEQRKQQRKKAAAAKARAVKKRRRVKKPHLRLVA